MITIKEYSTPKCIDEAYNLLLEKRNNVLFGGGAFIRMGSKNIFTAIDLSKSELDYIIEEDKLIRIGAMTTFGDIEYSPLLKQHYNDVLSKSVSEIVGIQLRNIVTVGGTVYSRYGFSDFITGLLALDTTVNLYKQGSIPLEEFLKKGSKERDILESISIEKDDRKATFLSMRNSQGDYAILNVAISVLDGKYRIAVGARPKVAVLALESMNYLNGIGKDLSPEDILEAAKIASEELAFGTNTRGSSTYRKQICYVLVKRALKEVVGYED